MWESLRITSHGGFSVRRIISVALTVLTVAFLWIAVHPQAVAAADASWSGSDLTYEGNTYNGPASAATVQALNLPSAPSAAYTYTDTSSTPQKLHVLYFAPGTTPSSATSTFYRTYDYNGPNQFANPSSTTTITISSAGPPGTTTPSAGSSGSTGTSSCEIDGGLGWVICPVSNFLASGMDMMFTILADFLEVRKLEVSQDSAMYRAWSYMRTFANVAFVIAFLIIIYSQLTNFGISNYSLKRLLPRVIIAAILVNLSFIICAIAIDISNLLGYSMQNIFIMLRDGLVGAEGANWNIYTWESITSFVLAGGTAAVAGGIALFTTISTFGPYTIFLILPVLLGVFIALLVALLIIAARQAIITVLTIIAPLAFVAYLLPNTEKWFDKWRGLFMTMLIFFPAFSLVFGGSQLAGAIIIQNANSINLVVLGMAVQVAPLVITPLLLKLSGNLLSRIAGIVNNPNRGLLDRTRNWAKDRAEDGRARRMATPAHRFDLMKRVGQSMDHNRRRREGFRSAYNAMADANFTQTQDGQNIQHLQHQAHFEKEEGEGLSHEHWGQVVNDPNGPYRARRVEQIRRRGLGDLNTAEVDAAGNDALQAQIDATPHLSAIAERTAVMQGTAQIHKGRVDARGKLAFRNAVMGDRALRLAEVDTHAMEQQASLSEAIIKGRAEAHWNNLKIHDDGVRHMQLQQADASNAAKQAEEQWNSIMEDIMSKGSKAAGISAADASLANALQQVHTDIAIEGKRQESFKLEQQQNLATLFKTDEAIRMRAGGNSPEGANRVFAQAKSALTSAFMETVKNNQSVISDYTINELMRLSEGGQKRIKDASGNIQWVEATEAERLAAYREVLLTKGSNWAVQKLKDSVAQDGMLYDEDTGSYYASEAAQQRGEQLSDDEVETRRDRQQIFIDAYKQSKHNVASLSGADMSDLETGKFRFSTRDAILRDIKGKKVKADRWVSSDLDELQRMIQVLRREDSHAVLAGDDESRGALKAMIDTITHSLSTPRVSERIDTRNQELMAVIKRYAQNMLSSDAPLSYAEKNALESDPVWDDEPGSTPKIKAPTKYIYDAPPDINVGPDPTGDNNNETPY